MNVKHLLPIADLDELKEQLEDYLNDHAFDLGLEDCCHRGGYPDLDTVTINEVSRERDRLSASATAYFSEVLSTSCADVDVSYNKSCSFIVDVDESGRVELTDFDEGWDGEEHGEQDFDDTEEPDSDYDPSLETEF